MFIYACGVSPSRLDIIIDLEMVQVSLAISIFNLKNIVQSRCALTIVTATNPQHLEVIRIEDYRLEGLTKSSAGV
jgi:hypothetical protein